MRRYFTLSYSFLFRIFTLSELKQGDYFTFSMIYRIEWQYDNMSPKMNPKVNPKTMKMMR